MSRPIVLFDSCVLYPAPIRDPLMRLALTDTFQAKWTNEIHDEWIRSLSKNRPDIPLARLFRTRDLMNMHVRDCLIDDYQSLVGGLSLPDSNDRHVLAAAIKASAQSIITYNLADFPCETLGKYQVEALHPDDFIRALFDISPGAVIEKINEARIALKNPPKSSDEYLTILLQQGLPRTVEFASEFLLP